jgi:Spy/CpxP family protein refolding chaperone
MKKLIFSIVAAAFAAITIQAQEIPERKREEFKPVEKAKMFNKKELANLDLTREQKTKLKSMKQDLRQQMDEVRKQDNLSAKEYREKMETLRKDQQAKFQSILTPGQKTEMEKYKEARNAKVKGFGKKKEAKMKEELKLTDEQLAKMTENRTASAQKLKAIRENDSLKDEQKKEQKKNMKSLLTEEQLQKMKENRKQHSKKGKVI